MPELPEVEIVKRALEPVMLKHPLQSLKFNRADLRFPLPKDLPTKLADQKIASIQRRGKYILAFADNGHGFVLHLGMSGVIRIEHAQEETDKKHDHVLWTFANGPRVVLNDARRFGFVQAVNQDSWQGQAPFNAMGPEPLGNDFNGAALKEALHNKKTSIKSALLDQRVVAGIGNIYACEALYDSGIDPQRQSASLAVDECEDLAGAIKAVLLRAIDKGGSSLKDYKHTDGNLGYFQHHFSVYDREGQPCPAPQCGCEQTGGVKRIVQQGRSTFFCPHRQS